MLMKTIWNSKLSPEKCSVSEDTITKHLNLFALMKTPTKLTRRLEARNKMMPIKTDCTH